MLSVFRPDSNQSVVPGVEYRTGSRPAPRYNKPNINSVRLSISELHQHLILIYMLENNPGVEETVTT